MAAASVWELLAGLAYHVLGSLVEKEALLFEHRITLFGKGIWFWMQELYEICREKKENTIPRMTNQDLAEKIGKSTTTVAQFLRGEAPNASAETVLAICKELGVSVDACIGLTPETPQPDAALLEQLHALETENRALHDGMDGLNAHLATCKKSMRMHRFVTAVLLVMVFLALIALLYDVLNPNVGWIRDQLAALMQHPFTI